MKPTQEQIDRRVVEARTQSSSSVLVALADKGAELERAAETSGAEHAEVVAELAEETLAHELTREAVKAAVDEWNGVSAALGLATARIRELEGEREELLGLVKRINALELENWPTRKNARYVDQRDELTAESCAIVARIEKATKGTT